MCDYADLASLIQGGNNGYERSEKDGRPLIMRRENNIQKIGFVQKRLLLVFCYFLTFTIAFTYGI